jgi:hypothetical protein
MHGRVHSVSTFACSCGTIEKNYGLGGEVEETVAAGGDIEGEIMLTWRHSGI